MTGEQWKQGAGADREAKHTCISVVPPQGRARDRSDGGERFWRPATSPHLSGDVACGRAHWSRNWRGVNGNRWTSFEHHDLHMTVFLRPLMLPRRVAVQISLPLLLFPGSDARKENVSRQGLFLKKTYFPIWYSSVWGLWPVQLLNLLQSNLPEVQKRGALLF